MYWFAGALLANSIVGGFWNPFYPDKKRKGKMPKINEVNLGQKKHGITDLMIHGAEHAPNVQAMMLGATYKAAFNTYMEWVETNMGAEAVNDPLIIEVGKNVAFLKATIVLISE